MADRQRKQQKAAPDEPTFESALERLEEIAGRLEAGDLPLEEAIALAEEGLILSQFCEKQLAEAEGRIDQLVERMGVAGLEPTDSEAQTDEGVG